MEMSVLRGIRVDSIKELRERISQYIDQGNEKTVIFKEGMKCLVESQSKMELIRNRCTRYYLDKN